MAFLGVDACFWSHTIAVGGKNYAGNVCHLQLHDCNEEFGSFWNFHGRRCTVEGPAFRRPPQTPDQAHCIVLTACAAGTFGGSVQNANVALATFVSQLHLANGSVAIPGFYEYATLAPV